MSPSRGVITCEYACQTLAGSGFAHDVTTAWHGVVTSQMAQTIVGRVATGDWISRWRRGEECRLARKGLRISPTFRLPFTGDLAGLGDALTVITRSIRCARDGAEGRGCGLSSSVRRIDSGHLPPHSMARRLGSDEPRELQRFRVKCRCRPAAERAVMSIDQAIGEFRSTVLPDK